MSKQEQWDNTFLDVCEAFAKHSACVSFQVAAVAVQDGRIVATGINGTPSGYCNCNNSLLDHNKDGFNRELHHQWSLVHEVHSEQNLIATAAKNGIQLSKSTVYVTMTPCTDCMKLMIAAGIKRIVYRRQYDKSNPQSLMLAEACGVKLQYIPETPQIPQV